MKPYKHVGIHLQLYGSDNHRNHRFSYPTNGNSDAIDVEENFIFSTWFRDSKTLHKWHIEYLSGYNPEGEKKVHQHDVKIVKGTKESIIEVPILRSENIGQDMGIDEKMIGEQWYTILTNRQTGKIAICAATTKSLYLQQAMAH